jgi:hypothetical protein
MRMHVHLSDMWFRGGNYYLPVCYLLFFLMIIIAMHTSFLCFIEYQKKVEEMSFLMTPYLPPTRSDLGYEISF